MSPAASRRAALWRTAEALSTAVGPELSPRARRLAVRHDPPMTLDDLWAVPEWASGDAGGRKRLARLAGAAACAQAWRRSIDGRTLRRAAEAIGEPALDALIALPEVMTPAAGGAAARSGDLASLEALGGALLMASDPQPPSLAPRLQRMLGALPDATVDAETAAVARRTAEALAAQTSATQLPAGEA